jgi:hypothetical protein
VNCVASLCGDLCCRLLEEFPAMVCSSKRLPPVSHDVVHNIL